MAEYSFDPDGAADEGVERLGLTDRLRKWLPDDGSATLTLEPDLRDADEIGRAAVTLTAGVEGGSDVDVMFGVPEPYLVRTGRADDRTRSRVDTHENVDILAPVGGDRITDEGFLGDVRRITEGPVRPDAALLPARRDDEAWRNCAATLGGAPVEPVDEPPVETIGLDAGDRLHLPGDVTLTQLDGDGGNVFDVEHDGHHALVALGARWLDDGITETYETVTGEAYDPDVLAIGDPTPTDYVHGDGTLRAEGDVVLADAPPTDPGRVEAQLKRFADAAAAVVVGRPVDEETRELFERADVEALVSPETPDNSVSVGPTAGHPPRGLATDEPESPDRPV